jgi:hypothetical protein
LPKRILPDEKPADAKLLHEHVVDERLRAAAPRPSVEAAMNV